ncbi:hypothetical protein LOY33_12040 [Pseudomonas sp. B21-036]|jgi:hypothetical protein|uniref:hypothetical protein n=1 Tax=Pseudomonas sp. B21-036 TaxID=2895485 RepID=UPI00215F0550|nr:hypothetical protein [Pseudomonas sp. B21-036]UVL53596.1 hypothetical protein LOY33_12040 [Pseudomonas sp. B21-036]
MKSLCDDESFSSLVMRDVFKAPEVHTFDDEIKDFTLEGDPDFDHTYTQSGSAAVYDRVKPHDCWIIPHTVSDFVCMQCLASSLKEYHALRFMKAWRQVAQPFCKSHNKLLDSFPARNSDLMNFLVQKPSSLRTTLPESVLQMIACAAIKIYEDLIETMHFECPAAAQKRFSAFRFLLELFLHAQSDSGGIASFYMSAPRPRNSQWQPFSWQSSFQTGAVISNALERGCAIIMFHAITSDASQISIAPIAAQITGFGYHYPIRPESIGSLSRLVMSEVNPAVTARLYSYSEILNCAAYQSFLRGFHHGKC